MSEQQSFGEVHAQHISIKNLGEEKEGEKTSKETV